MPRVSATAPLKPIAALGATAIVRFVRRAFVKGAAAGGALAVLAAITLALLAAATPSDDFLFLPSPAQPVAPVVKVAGEPPDPPRSGPGFLFTAVTQRRASRLESWLPFLRDDHSELVPGHALIPPGGTPEEQDRVDRVAMTDSQRTAAAVAEKALGRDVRITTRGVRVDDTAVPGGSPHGGLRARPGHRCHIARGSARVNRAQDQILPGKDRDANGLDRRTDANSRSTICAAGRDRAVLRSSVGRSAPGRVRAWTGEGIIGQGGATSAGDRIARDGHADLARSGGPCSKDFHQRCATEDAEKEAEGQEAELADAHVARISRRVLLRLRGTTPRSA